MPARAISNQGASHALPSPAWMIGLPTLNTVLNLVAIAAGRALQQGAQSWGLRSLVGGGLQFFGAAAVGASAAAFVAYALEFMPDDILGENLKSYVKVAKCAIPMLVAAGVTFAVMTYLCPVSFTFGTVQVLSYTLTFDLKLAAAAWAYIGAKRALEPILYIERFVMLQIQGARES